ncbi:hypothetical protein FOXG_10323 [Fusarium oxysporum f. sp. lycopersici 4287]|uniref:Uncharacterized protein n=1 Tax=Fusarium oxysporum f. sp. lycopersici (strain 4287 / CBS 123668 / FGSC 9935 / NRRL 34936) TaxID=426428 RepID=A0A0J9VFZ8_FUSO4|nr:hypothetical protein FOXG_10323 [Fusarium oxysporum f. sp. lycopersici 4287]KNB09890.1 hypothetical protein FOXG_10323 [Fusarium oxysporum f. sp. lycopersici 4287]
MKHNNNVRLLAVLADPESDEKSEYRFLVDGAHVRYVTLDGGLIDPEHRTYEPKLLPQLPVFPPGDWNEGRVGKDGHTGKPFFCETRRSSLPGIGNVWHDVMIDHLELRQSSVCAKHSIVYRILPLRHRYWQSLRSFHGRFLTSLLRRLRTNGFTVKASVLSFSVIFTRTGESLVSSSKRFTMLGLQNLKISPHASEVCKNCMIWVLYMAISTSTTSSSDKTAMLSSSTSRQPTSAQIQIY